jgi:5-methyltetrahydrofolate--homocysteine methyltransferase
MNQALLETVSARRLVCDGAMGTQLMLAGLGSGACGDLWNCSNAGRVLAIQRRYAEAGADCLITNTFGASRIALARHGLERDVPAINKAGVRIAREAFGARGGFVLGDVGPLGALLEPYGELSLAEAGAALAEQITALVRAGVDAVILETQTSLDELGLAIDASKAAGAPCIIASLAYDLSSEKNTFATMMGVTPEKAAVFAGGRGAHIVGLNCGTGVDMAGAARILRDYRKQTQLPLMAQPNAGLPVLEGGRPVYRQTPADMAGGVPELLAAGAGIVGSCCGSAPEHTRAIRQAIDEASRKQR